MGGLVQWVREGPNGDGRGASAERLHARVADCFATITRAWNNRDADAMRRHASVGYRDRSRLALHRLDREFRISHIEVERMRNVALQRPGEGGRTEPIHAYLAFAARVWLEDLRSGEVLAGSPADLTAFTQRLTLVHELRRGWVADRVESVWTAPVEELGRRQWHGLPPGWYSTRDRPSDWRQWDGRGWAVRGEVGAS